MDFLTGVMLGVVLCIGAYYLQERYNKKALFSYTCLVETCKNNYTCEDPLALIEMMETHEQWHKENESLI